MPTKIQEHVRHEIGNNPERALLTTQRELDQQREQLNRQPLTAPDSRLYAPGTPLAVGDNRIAHKLGRKPKGYVVTRSTGGAADLYEVSRDDRFITLNSGNTATVEILFF